MVFLATNSSPSVTPSSLTSTTTPTKMIQKKSKTTQQRFSLFRRHHHPSNHDENSPRKENQQQQEDTKHPKEEPHHHHHHRFMVLRSLTSSKNSTSTQPSSPKSRRHLISTATKKNWSKRLGFHHNSKNTTGRHHRHHHHHHGHHHHHHHHHHHPNPELSSSQELESIINTSQQEGKHHHLTSTTATNVLPPKLPPHEERLGHVIELLQSELLIENQDGLEQIMTILKTVSFTPCGTKIVENDSSSSSTNCCGSQSVVALELAHAIVFDNDDDHENFVVKKDYHRVRQLLATFLCNSIWLEDIMKDDDNEEEDTTTTTKDRILPQTTVFSKAVRAEKEEDGITTDDETASHEHDENDHDHDDNSPIIKVQDDLSARDNDNDDEVSVGSSVMYCYEEEEYYYENDSDDEEDDDDYEENEQPQGRHEGALHTFALEILIQALQLVVAVKASSGTDSPTATNSEKKNRFMNFDKTTTDHTKESSSSVSFWNPIVTDCLVPNLERLQMIEMEPTVTIATLSIQCIQLLHSLEPTMIEFLVQTVLFPYIIHAEELGQVLQHTKLERFAQQLLHQTTMKPTTKRFSYNDNHGDAGGKEQQQGEGEEEEDESCCISQTRVYL